MVQSGLVGFDDGGWGRSKMVLNRPDVARSVYEWTRKSVPSCEQRTTSSSGDEKWGWKGLGVVLPPESIATFMSMLRTAEEA